MAQNYLNPNGPYLPGLDSSIPGNINLSKSPMDYLGKLNNVYQKTLGKVIGPSPIGPITGGPIGGNPIDMYMSSLINPLPHTWGEVALQALPLLIGAGVGMRGGMKGESIPSIPKPLMTQDNLMDELDSISKTQPKPINSIDDLESVWSHPDKEGSDNLQILHHPQDNLFFLKDDIGVLGNHFNLEEAINAAKYWVSGGITPTQDRIKGMKIPQGESLNPQLKGVDLNQPLPGDSFKKDMSDLNNWNIASDPNEPTSTWVHPENQNIYVEQQPNSEGGNYSVKELTKPKKDGVGWDEITHGIHSTLEDALDSAHSIVKTKQQFNPLSAEWVHPQSSDIKIYKITNGKYTVFNQGMNTGYSFDDIENAKFSAQLEYNTSFPGESDIPTPLFSKINSANNKFKSQPTLDSPLSPDDPRNNYTSLPGYKESRSPNRPIESYLKDSPKAVDKVPISGEDTSLNDIINSRHNYYHTTGIDNFESIMKSGVINPGSGDRFAGVAVSRVPKIPSKSKAISFIIDPSTLPTSKPTQDYGWTKSNGQYEFETRTVGKPVLVKQSVKGILVDLNQLKNSGYYPGGVEASLKRIQTLASEHNLPVKVVSNWKEANKYRAGLSKTPIGTPLIGLGVGALGLGAWEDAKKRMNQQNLNIPIQ